MAKHISHVKSKVVETTTIDGVSVSKPKLPEAEDLYYGEIAVNYAKGHERLAIKNDNEEIVTFVNENDFIESERVIANALTDLDSRINDLSVDIDDLNTSLSNDIDDLNTSLSNEIDTLETNLSNQIGEVTDVLEEAERVTAESLNDLNSRIIETNETIDDLENEITSLSNNIDEIDKVTAQGFIDVDTRLKDLDADVSSIQGGLNNRYTKTESDASHVKKVTYSQLVTLITNKELVPGTFYRITDYVTTTVQENTQSAGKTFDLLVLATDVDRLSEDAKALTAPYGGYFPNSDLNAWEIKYDINNDTTKYGWADEENGKGVIYYMKDEWGNECPYDFKNIQFKRWAVTAVSNTDALSRDSEEALSSSFVYDVINSTNIRFSPHSSNFSYGNTNFTVDENNEVFYFTFSSHYSTSIIEDASTLGNNFYKTSPNQTGCIGNVIKPYYNNSVYDPEVTPSEHVGENGAQFLNNIVFVGSHNRKDTTAGTVYNHNTCSFNYIDANSHDITFGNSAQYNKLINGECSFIIFGNNCTNNVLNKMCTYNVFAGSCSNNVLANACRYNLLIDANTNVFNTISSRYNILGKNCTANIVNGDYIVLNENCRGNIFGHLTENIRFETPYTCFVTVEEYNSYITLECTNATDSNNLLQNIRIAQGVNNTQTMKTIQHATVNDSFTTLYQGSTTIPTQV